MRFGIRRCSDWQQTSWNSKTLVTHTSLGFCKDPVTYVEMLYEQKVSKYKVLHSPAWEKFLGQKLQGSEMIMIVEDDRICPEGELERGRSISDTIYLTVVMSKHSQSVGGLCGWRKEKGHLDWDNLGLRTKWDKTWDAWPNTWHTERQQLAQAITMISMCQAHLPQVFRALSTGLSSSFFIGDLNKWGCQLSEQQLEETGDSLTPGLDYFLYTVDSSHISFTLKKEKNKLLIKMGCFSWNQRISEASEGGSLATCSTLRSATWRRKWQSTPGFLPEESHSQRSLAGSWVSKSQAWLGE